VLIEQAANNLQSAPKHVHVTHLARLDMTEHSAVSERSTGLHRFAKITPPTSSQDRDSKLWITQRGQPAGRRAQSAVRSGCRLIGAHRLGRADQADLPRRVLARRRLETHSHADVRVFSCRHKPLMNYAYPHLQPHRSPSRQSAADMRLPLFLDLRPFQLSITARPLKPSLALKLADLCTDMAEPGAPTHSAAVGEGGKDDRQVGLDRVALISDAGRRLPSGSVPGVRLSP
jgi:hypothetical protein